MATKLNIDPKKVAYDGRSFKLIIENEKDLLEKLMKKQQEIIQDLDNSKESIED